MKSGHFVREVANEYGIGTKSVYTWLGRGAEKSSDVLEMSRLRRENEALRKRIEEVMSTLPARAPGSCLVVERWSRRGEGNVI